MINHKTKAVERSRLTKIRFSWSVVAVLGGFFLLAAAATWPFLLHPSTTLTAPIGGDVSNSSAYYQSIISNHANPFTTTHIDSVNYPDGYTLNTGVNRVSFLSVILLWLGSKTFGVMPTHGIEAISGYILTSFMAFFFVRRVTNSTAAGAVSGLIFGFSPHMYAIARAAPTYTHMWLLLLPILAFWSLLQDREPKLRKALMAGLSVVPAIFWTPYFALHILIVGAACLVVATIFLLNRLSTMKAVSYGFLIGGMWSLILSIYWFIGTHGPSLHVPERTLQEAYEQAAHPIMYLLPGYFSWWGQPFHRFASSIVPGSSSINLYVGLSVISLALIGLLMIRRRPHISQYDLGIKTAAYLATGVVLVCFLFSLPPKVHFFGRDIVTPNSAVVGIMPALRAGQRFVMPIMGAVSVLAAIGSLFIFDRFRGFGRSLIIVLILLVVGLDLFSLPPESTTTMPKYSSLAMLAKQPEGAAAQYKDSSLLAYPNQMFCLLQTQHHKPLVNDCGLARDEKNLNAPPKNLDKIKSLSLCQQIDVLKAIKTKYLIVSTHQIQDFAYCFKSWSYKPTLIGKDASYTVYKI